MRWIWLGIVVFLIGTVHDIMWHEVHGYHDEHWIPPGHFVQFLGIVIALVGSLRMKRDGKLPSTITGSLLWILPFIQFTGWLWDNLVYHTRGIYSDPIQGIPHAMINIGAFIFVIVSIIVSLTLLSQRGSANVKTG